MPRRCHRTAALRPMPRANGEAADRDADTPSTGSIIVSSIMAKPCTSAAGQSTLHGRFHGDPFVRSLTASGQVAAIDSGMGRRNLGSTNARPRKRPDSSEPASRTSVRPACSASRRATRRTCSTSWARREKNDDGRCGRAVRPSTCWDSTAVGGAGCSGGTSSSVSMSSSASGTEQVPEYVQAQSAMKAGMAEGGPVKTTLPVCMTMTLSKELKTCCDAWWMTAMRGVRDECATVRRRLVSEAAVVESRPDVYSSSSRATGDRSSSMPMDTRFRWPPDSTETGMSATWPMASVSSIAVTECTGVGDPG
mmetsp:Transcript_3778/g.12221  ORF Transcript_3778/g.12221 Transcript_3778/m.12221 type:complete len:308 (+) Transcript_3778:2386-3309(+)